MYYRGGADSESRWPGATFGGDEAEAVERGGETDLQFFLTFHFGLYKISA